jgi:uncharacterized Tic20 family protein
VWAAQNDSCLESKKEEGMDNRQTDSVAKSQDDRIMAAIAHVTAMLPMMGILAPIVIWVTQKEKSHFVSFQSLQALVYQLFMILVWVIGMIVYFASFIIIIPLSNSFTISSSAFGQLLVIIPFLLIGIVFLVEFIMMVYGVEGAVRVLQGKDFRYALLGERLKRYLDEKGHISAYGG